jgi:hypothetical protein
VERGRGRERERVRELGGLLITSRRRRRSKGDVK